VGRIRDVEGQRFGKLVAIRPTEKRYHGAVVWVCQCDCGERFEVTGRRLIAGLTKSCGCSRQERVGRAVSVETRAKLVVSHTGKKHSPETLEKMRIAHTGFRHSPEAFVKMRAAAQRRKPPSPETRAKMSAARKGEKLPPLQLSNLRAALSKPETRAKRVASLLRRNAQKREEKLRQRGLFPEATDLTTVTPQELHEGQTISVQGSAEEPYMIRRIDGQVSCSCPAWQFLGGRIRICKHIRATIALSSLPMPELGTAERIDFHELLPTTTNSGLYRIVCVNGNFYIGEAQLFEKRWRRHRFDLEEGRQPRPPGHRGKWGHHNTRLQADYNLLGAEAFLYQAYRDIPDKIERQLAERRDIRAHIGPYCYNESEYSPPSHAGRKQSSETLAKRIGQKRSEETKARMRVAQNNPAVRAARSAALTGREVSAETRAKQSVAQKGKQRSPEAKARMSEAHRGMKPSLETRAKMSAAHKLREFTPEHRAKIAAAQCRPEARAKRSADASKRERTALGTFSSQEKKS
jgi:hypothetical protein